MYDDIKLNQDNYESGGFRDFLAFGVSLVGEYLFQLLNSKYTAKRHVSSYSKMAWSYPSSAKF